jgi:uncharacterized membrane protein
MKNKMLLYVLLAVVGVIIAIVAFFLKGASAEKLSGLFMGVGAGVFGGSAAMAISTAIEKKYPEVKRKKDIEVNDERNISVRNKAKAQTHNVMTQILYFLTAGLAIANVDMVITLSMVGAIILQTVLYIVFFNHYNKVM